MIEAQEMKSWWLMPSLKECLKEYQAQDIGLIEDIAKHGCSGGVSGVTYYSLETCSVIPRKIRARYVSSRMI